MMDKPIFVDFETKICSAYLNAVASTVWDALGQAENPQEARQFIGAVEEAPTDGSSYARQNAQWVQIQVGNLHNDLAGRSSADAHPVSAITGLQALLDQINLDLSGKAPASAGTAAGTAFSPTGSIVATNVQAALAEVDGDVTANTGSIAALNTAAVKKTSATGAALMPSGTTAQRDTTTVGAMRYNSQLDLFEGLTGIGWGVVGGGITQVQADARYLQLTGGTLTGNLTAPAMLVNAAQNASANALTRKDYVDRKTAGPAFAASGVLAQFTVNVSTKVSATQEIFDTDNCYDAPNSRFTPNVSGYYQCNISLNNQVAIDTFGMYGWVSKNGTVVAQGGSTGNATAFAFATASCVVYMNGTTDYIEGGATLTGPTGTGTGNGICNHFSAALVRQA